MVFEVLKKARAEGLQLYVHSGRLKYRAHDKPPSDTLTAEIKQNKAALIALLAGQEMAQAPAKTLTPSGLPCAPLTQNQARVFYQDAAFDTGDTYIMEVAYCFDSLLDPTRLRQAFLKIVERHHVLRSRFFMGVGDLPRQEVVQEPIDCLVMSFDPEQEPDHWLRSRKYARCDLAKGQVLNIALLHKAGQSHLHIACHHIAFDGGSYQTLFADLVRFYDDPFAEVSPLSLQYTDYANSDAAQNWSTQSQTYWRTQMEGVSSFNGLPSDKPRPLLSSFSGQSLRRIIPADVEEGLTGLAAEVGVSRFAAFLAAFYVQLSRYTRTEDCVIGTPLSGRTLPQLDGLIGFFANAIPLRAKVDHNLSFTELLKQTHKTSLMAQQHQDLDVKQIISDLGYAGETAFTPLTQIMFSFEETRDESLMLGDHRGEKLPLTRHHAAFDLECSLIKQANGPLEVFWVYADALFEAQTISDFADTFDITLRQLIASPNRPLKEIPIGDSGLNGALPQVRSDLSPRFIDMFDTQVAKSPQAAACKWLGEDGTVVTQTYAALNAQANAMAQELLQHGITANTPVAVCVGTLADTIANLVAVQKTGAAYMILDPGIPPDRSQMMYAQAGCHCAIGQAIKGQLPPDAHVVEVVSESNRDSQSRTKSGVVPDSVAAILFTSGSTGTPKGVKLSQSAIGHFLVAAQGQLELMPKDCFAVASTLTFDAHIMEIYLALANGASLALLDPARARDAEFLQQDQHLLGISYFFATPTSWQILRNANWCPRDGMTLITGGESLPQNLSDDLLGSAHNLRLLNVYGPTEATVFNLCAFMQPHAPVHMGVTLSDNQVYLQDAYGHPCPPSCRGEIVISGPQVGQGYLGPQEGFFEGPIGWSYATGDIARQGLDGRFIMVGREDFQVKINGVRLELNEIGTALERHPSVNRATVIVVQPDAAGMRLAAYVETTMDQHSVAAQLSRFLATLVPRSHLPSSFTVVDRMPLTPSGKIDRNALPAPTTDTAIATGRTPETTLEQAICAIWSVLLERTIEDVDTGFFELGGHSLLAIKMINRVNRTCGTDLKMRDVVGELTVADLVQRIGTAERTNGRAALIPKTDTPLPAPLSFAQERIWTIDQIEASGAYYTIPLIFEVKGHGFDQATSASFLNALIDKHRIFATVYNEQDGVPFQNMGHAGPDIAFTNATNSADPAAELADVEHACLNAPFDLRDGPVLRAHLVKLDTAHHMWFLALHHIAFDGTSLALFVRELKTYLAQGSLGQEHAPSYADYARWQCDTYDPTSDLTYWKDRLHDAPAVHQLPLDRPRLANQSFGGTTLVQQLKDTLSHDLRALAAASNSTEFGTIFALFAAYLQLISGESDVVLGTPVANRQSPELENTIGCFINTVPLRVQLDPNDSLSTLVPRVHANLQSDLSHDGVPFEKLVHAVCEQRSFSHNPVFQIMIQLDNSESHDFCVGATQFNARQPLETEAKFDLTLGVRLDGGIALSWNYATDLFDRTSIEAMMAGFVDWAETCFAAPDAPLATPALMDGSTPVSGPVRTVQPQKVADRFLAAAERHPDRIAVCDGSIELTYRQLETKARVLSDVLCDHGVGPDMLVGVHLPRSAELVIAVVACCLRGCAYLPLDPTYPSARSQTIVASARPALVLCADDFADFPAPQYDISQQQRRSGETAYAPRMEMADTAYVIYTSGSTGQPKGVQVGHASLANFLNWMTVDLGLRPDARVLQVTSSSFDISVTEILVPLAQGGSVVIAPSMVASGTAALLDVMVQRGVSVLQMVPGMLQALLDAAGPRKFTGITHLYCGGETVPAKLLKAAQNHFPNAQIFAVYGPTEATIWASAYEYTVAPADGSLPLGQPAANTWLKVLDDHGQPVPRGRTGGLFIGGAALAKGYLGDPERTAAAFVTDAADGQRLYDTGDLVRVAKDGRLIFVGRADTQIKLRGHRIEMGEIEAALLAAGASTVACVLSDDTLTAFVDAAAPDHLRETLSSRLPDYMMPTRIVSIETFPKTPNGKVDRTQLTSNARSVSSQPDNAPPVGETEETLAEIWQEALDCGPLGRHQNFFALGGHSLLAIRIMTTVSAILEQDVPVRVLFANPSIADLAAYIENQVLGMTTKGQPS